MADELQLFTKGDTEGEYLEYTPPTFAERLPEEHRENEVFQGVGNLGGLAERHVNTAKELADLKSAQPVFPKNGDGYVIPDMPEGVTKDEQGISDFKALAHEIKLTQAQVDKIVALDIGRAQRGDEEFKALHTKTLEDAEGRLKKHWGNDYEANKEMASTGLRQVLASFKDGEEIEKELADNGVLSIPAVMRVFRKVGLVTSEDVFVKSTRAPDSTEIPRGADGRVILDYPTMKDT